MSFILLLLAWSSAGEPVKIEWASIGSHARCVEISRNLTGMIENNGGRVERAKCDREG